MDIEVYFNSGGIANIVSIKKVSRIYKIIMDTQKSKCITLYTYESTSISFKRHGLGVYYYDIVGGIDKKQNKYTCISPVKENQNYYSRKEIKATD